MHNIDYNIRPAKYAERLLIAKTLIRLQPFRAVESYRYIGFGATYFKDFKLFHRDLNISNMISIEKDRANKERYDFNKPFKCINMEYGTSTEILPKLSWEEPTILWLDYIGKMSRDCLADITAFTSRAKSGSVLIVTLNADNSRDDDDIEIADEDRSDLLKKLILRVGDENIPLGTTSKDLIKWGTAEIYRQIVTNKVLSSLDSRNGILPGPNKIVYEQLFNFRYADGARMVTIGGIMYERSQDHIKQFCLFNALPYISSDNIPYEIEIPNLTTKEVKYLESKFPSENVNSIDRNGIPKEDIDKFHRIYRVFPSFTAVDL